MSALRLTASPTAWRAEAPIRSRVVASLLLGGLPRSARQWKRQRSSPGILRAVALMTLSSDMGSCCSGEVVAGPGGGVTAGSSPCSGPPFRALHTVEIRERLLPDQVRALALLGSRACGYHCYPACFVSRETSTVVSGSVLLTSICDPQFLVDCHYRINLINLSVPFWVSRRVWRDVDVLRFSHQPPFFQRGELFLPQCRKSC